MPNKSTNPSKAKSTTAPKTTVAPALIENSKMVPLLGSVSVITILAVAGMIGTGVFDASKTTGKIEDEVIISSTVETDDIAINEIENSDVAQAEAERLATIAAAEAEAQRLAEVATAEAEAQRLAEVAAAEAEAQRLVEVATAEAEAQRLAEVAAAEAEAQRLAEVATAEAEAQRLAEVANAEAEAQRLAEVAAAEAEAQRLAEVAVVEPIFENKQSNMVILSNMDIMTNWSVKLPFQGQVDTNVIAQVDDLAPDWAREGVRITAVNGVPIQKIPEIETILRGILNPDENPFQTVTFTYQISDDADPILAEWQMPIVHETLLSNGARFNSQFSKGTWKTVIANLPIVENNFEIGDELIAFLDTSERLESRTSLMNILKRELALGREQFNFAIARSPDGPMMFAGMSYSKGG